MGTNSQLPVDDDNNKTYTIINRIYTNNRNVNDNTIQITRRLQCGRTETEFMSDGVII